jgi:hypothetical protein
MSQWKRLIHRGLVACVLLNKYTVVGKAYRVVKSAFMQAHISSIIPDEDRDDYALRHPHHEEPRAKKFEHNPRPNSVRFHAKDVK